MNIEEKMLLPKDFLDDFRFHLVLIEQINTFLLISDGGNFL
jgi:hypothetical protein